MERGNINYSYKNIPIPNRHQYKLVLLRRIESFIKNMSWKAYFFSKRLTVRKRTDGRNMGLELRNPPHFKEMDKFETEMIGMVKEIKFRKMRNNIQQKCMRI